MVDRVFESGGYVKFIARIIIACIDIVRPLLGPSGCCIYPVTCREYARQQLVEKPLYQALPLIVVRLLSCNPITRLFMR